MASTFVSRLEAVEQERAIKVQHTSDAQRALDDMVLDAYGVTLPSWRAVVELGVPLG